MTLPSGVLTEAGLRKHVWPLFSRTLARPGVYLANHSLGRPLDKMANDVSEFTRTWYEEMDQAWDIWQAEQGRFTANVERLIGARPGTVTQRASAGQGLRAVLNSFPNDRQISVVTTTGEFDSLDFILRAYEMAGRIRVKWVEPSLADGVPTFDYEKTSQVVVPSVDFLVVSHVFFGTGQIMPGLKELVGQCGANGVLTLADLYHSAGAMPLDVSDLAVDFAVGGSYKYLRGGPGASWLYVNLAAIEHLQQTLDTGWFAKADNFDYRRGDQAARQPGIGGWAESTPPVIATYQARSGLDFTLNLGVDAIRAYSLERQAMLRAILHCEGVPVFEPHDPEAFGAFSLVPCDDAKQVCAKAAEKGLTVDARGSMIRLCPDILNTVEEFEIAARILAECLKVR